MNKLSYFSVKAIPEFLVSSLSNTRLSLYCYYRRLLGSLRQYVHVFLSRTLFTSAKLVTI